MNSKKTFLKHLFHRPYRNETHSQLIKKLIEQSEFLQSPQTVWIEIGAGFTTLMLAEIADKYNAILYSCDANLRKINDLKTRLGEKAKNVSFVHGNSLQSLPSIIEKHTQVHFVFFDSAPSAMHTFREFQIIEPCLKNGSCIIIDNAALPNEHALLTACRKGKILVPYLLASANWKVTGHPHSGDSMVSAAHMPQSDHADSDYELKGWNDSWKYKDNDVKTDQL